MELQSRLDLDAFYSDADPWGYSGNPDDERRRAELLSALPRRQFKRCLDIGCGNGFVTCSLPGDSVLGIDISPKAIEWARQHAAEKGIAERVKFSPLSLLDPAIADLGRFDLIVVTGVLYDQYIGKAKSVVRTVVDDLLEGGGVIASCHIRHWNHLRFAYTLLDRLLYPYREYTHHLEVLVK
ncbi:MAG: class I SAM-dependent methyltransferase [Pseudoxanthomonas sp.]